MALIISISISIFFLLFHSHLLFTLAEPLARSEELNRGFLGLRSAITTCGIAAIITLACIIIFKTNKQRASTEGSFGRFPVEISRCFSFDEIQAATGNFSRSSFIGREGFGGVYGGLIDEGKQKVVVKRLPLERWNEVKEVLSKLWHGNLVSLIGYCNKSGNMFLVYEDGMSLGTLADNLNTNTCLSWEQRLRICLGVARGLDYLHTGTDHGAIHGDLKCSNILLYENYKPKISDFRLTKLDELDQKLDVCSFGVVLLELLCGKIQPQHIRRIRSSFVRRPVEVDPRIKGEISAVCLEKIKAISEKCLHIDPKERPSMAQVVARLELLLEGEISSSSRPRNKEPVVHDNVHQSIMMERFQTATNNFSNTHILLDWGVYTIYRGDYVTFFCLTATKTSSYVMYFRGMHMPPTPDETSKLDKISNLGHKNLASMVGYCCSGGKFIVVGYENEGGGILYRELSNQSSWLSDSLTWEKRLEICIGAAKAVRFLHEAKIIHGCITASTILLDRKYRAKLATFGSMSTHYTFDRLVFVPLDIAGSTTPTEKTDVYFFGLLLYIVLCGKNVDYTHGYPFLLPAKVKAAADSNTLQYVTDINMRFIAERCLREFLRVADSCTKMEPGDRLPMDAVVEGLKKARALQAGAELGGSWS